MDEEALAQLIAAQEAASGTRSPLRDVIPIKPSEGVDLPPSWLEGGQYKAPDPSTTPIPWLDTIPLPPVEVPAEPLPPAPRFAVPGAIDLPTIEVYPSGEEPERPLIPPDPTERAMAAIDYSTRPVRQVASKFIGGIAGLPWDMAAGVASLPALSRRMLGSPDTEMEAAIDWLRGQGQGVRANIDKALGIGEPQTPVEQAAALTGESVVPYKKHTAALTAMLTGMRAATGAILPTPAEGAAKQTKEQKEQLKQQLREQAATRVIDTVGGPAQVKESELKTLGGMAVVSLGMVFAPTIFRNFKFGKLPRTRSVKDTVPGTETISTPTDLARVYDDVNAPLVRMARRGGINPATVSRLEDLLHIQTRASAQALADSAIRVGRAETPGFRFQSRVPLAEIAKMDNPEVSRYLHTLDTIDEIKIQSISQLNKRQPQTGPIVVNGMDLTQASAVKRSIEAANPQVIDIASAFRDNVRATHKFMAEGEYSTMSPSERRFRNSQRSNEVPWNGARVTGDPLVQRPPATEGLGTMMQRELRKRMENEVRGQYIDEVNKAGLNWFKRVTDKQLKDNPHWNKNTITMYRRGKAEHYTADPLLVDILKMDPYYFTSQAGQTIYAAKRMLEIGATGELAPWFSITSATRSYLIGKHTMGFGTGWKSPTIAGSLTAIPQQLLPQIARAVSSSLDRGSGGWLRQVLGSANVDAMSTRLANAYTNSLYFQLETAGGGRGSILQQQIVAGQNKLQQAIQVAQPTAKAWLEGYRSLLNAVHNAPSFSMAWRNTGRGTNELAATARHMTGDPRVGGQFSTGAHGRPIRFEDTSSRVSHTAGQVIKNTYGLTTEVGRDIVPWFNATMQGAKRIGEAYLDNPTAFTAKVWLYTAMPEAVSYLASRALDKDPNGNSYVDHKMNRRSDYNQQMNLYLPIPGRPAEDGIEIPRFHEVTPFGRLMGVALDHAFRSSIFTESQDFLKALNSFMEVAVIPPTPPAFGIAFGAQGIVTPQGAFGGEAYRPKQDPYDQNRGLPVNIELMVRALGGGIADIGASGYAAFTQTPKGVGTALANAGAEMGKRVIQKTPFVRDIVGLKPPISGNVPINEELFKKDKVINLLNEYLTKTEDEIKAKKTSGTGQLITDKLLGPAPPEERAGLGHAAPTNPLFIQFASELHDTFKKDDPEKGGIGFQSLWARYGQLSRNIKDMQNINTGNWVTWQERLKERPDQLKYLEDNKVDSTNVREVRNFYEKKRQDAGRVILHMIRGVEADFSKRIGRPIKIEDLDPYGKGLTGTGVSSPEMMDLGL